jgi:hypothetical protein
MSGIDAPAAGHAEVEHHRPVAVGVDQPVLGAPPHPGHARAGQRLRQIGGERAAQIEPVDAHARDGLPFQHGGEATNGGFDFG